MGTAPALHLTNVRTDEDAAPTEIALAEGRIACIGPSPTRTAEVIDGGGNLVLPGFINPHTHLDKADLLREMTPDQFGFSLEENRALMKHFKRNYRMEGVKERARKVALEMVGEGITTVRTQVDVDRTAGLVPLRALLELREELSPWVHIQVSAFPQEGVVGSGLYELLEEALHMGADLLGGLPLVEGTRQEAREHIDRLFRLATQNDVDLDVQVDESNDPDDFLLPYLVERTLAEGYEGRVTATHCIALSKVDDEVALPLIEKIARAGMNIIVTPSCNLITRFPPRKTRPYNSITRVRELVKAGVNVAVGTDNVRDIFYPLGNGSLLRELHVLATTTRMTGVEDVARLFAMVTANAGRIVGIEAAVERGKRADLVVLPAQTLRGALSGPPIIPCVIKGGRVVASARIERGEALQREELPLPAAGTQSLSH